MTEFQKFLDENQYSFNSVYRYERIFGKTYVSTGGEMTTKEFCQRMKLKKGQRILDIGCGTGGSAFFMSRYYGCIIEGIDLSKNMIQIANNYLSQEEKNVQDRVKFTLGNIFDMEYPENHFDIVYTRDALLHIKEKELLFQRIYKWLKPGGTLFITDYIVGDKEASPEFASYVKKRGYHLPSLSSYDSKLKSSGLTNIECEQASEKFTGILKMEMDFFGSTKQCFVDDFSVEDYNDIFNGWSSKIGFVQDGYMSWGIFKANK